MGKGLKWGATGVVFLGAVLAWSSEAAALQGLEGRYYASGGGASPQPPPGSPAGTTSTATPLLTRIDATVDFGFANPPGPGVPADGFMVAWTGYIRITNSGNYTFQVRIDDGARLWVNNSNVIDSWTDKAPTDVTSGAVALTAGYYPIRLEFYENGGGEECRLRYMGPDSNNAMVIIPSSVLSPVPPVPPATPANVQATALTSPTTGLPQITVTWDPSAGATGYQLYRTDNPPGFPITLTGTSYTDTTVSFGTYCYYVTASNAYGTSANSATACATTTPLPPRTGDHDEGFMDGRCSCGSSIRAGQGALLASWAGGLGAALLGFLRRRGV